MSTSVIIGLAILVGGCLFAACRPKRSLPPIDSTRGPHRDIYDSNREF
jgi:hypothetical protein